jgi:hypothetical protein
MAKNCSCSFNADISPNCGGGEYHRIKGICIKEVKFYRDDVYFGDVVFLDDKMIQVECKNGNKYMEGHIYTFHLVSTT